VLSRRRWALAGDRGEIDGGGLSDGSTPDGSAQAASAGDLGHSESALYSEEYNYSSEYSEGSDEYGDGAYSSEDDSEAYSCDYSDAIRRLPKRGPSGLYEAESSTEAAFFAGLNKWLRDADQFFCMDIEVGDVANNERYFPLAAVRDTFRAWGEALKGPSVFRFNAEKLEASLSRLKRMAAAWAWHLYHNFRLRTTGESFMDFHMGDLFTTDELLKLGRQQRSTDFLEKVASGAYNKKSASKAAAMKKSASKAAAMKKSASKAAAMKKAPKAAAMKKVGIKKR